MSTLQRRLFGIRDDEVRFERRGFRGGRPEVRARLEEIGRTFVRGYHEALEDADPARLATRLAAVPAENAGFAFEGAAMALALMDALTPWRRDRWRAFVAGAGSAHVYMVHVGVGWAAARLGGPIERFMRGRDPLLRWLVLDGFGFHEGYFHWPQSIEAHRRPPRLAGYERVAFDFGLGRSLWFVDASEPDRIERTIAGFDADRHAALWSGVGLASAYAGGVERAVLESLRTRAGAYLPNVAQGVAFAAKARERAGNPAAHTALACEVLCGVDAAAAARITDDALPATASNGDVPAYETWRQGIIARFASRAREWNQPAAV